MTQAPLQTRRRSLGALAALTTLGAAGALPHRAQAQAFPARSIKLVVPHAPGGNSDSFGRVLAQALTDRIGQSVVVENRTGAGGTIACSTVARSPADGYTLVVSDTGTHSIAPQLYGPRLQYDVFKDFTPITLAATFATVILVHPSVSARNAQEFIALAKAQPGKITYSSAGTGNGSHLALDTFRHEAGRLDMIHVPYKGGAPAIQALIAGEVQMTAVSVNTSLPHIRSGKARALALASSKRSPALPDLATLNEQGVPNAEADNWLGIHGPAGMPPEVVAWLNREIAAALQQPAIRERLAGQGLEVVASSPDAFVDVLRKDLARWTEAVKRSGATAG